MNSHAQHERDTWIEDFVDELHLRHVEDAHRDDAVRTAQEHLDDSEEPPEIAFGHPREYAASLDLPVRGAVAEKSVSFLAILLAMAAFTVFVITATRWIDGNDDTWTIVWCLSAAAVLQATSVGLSLGIARQVVQSTIRDRFSGRTARAWTGLTPWAIVTPCFFPAFASLVVAIALLR